MGHGGGCEKSFSMVFQNSVLVRRNADNEIYINESSGTTEITTLLKGF